MPSNDIAQTYGSLWRRRLHKKSSNELAMERASYKTHTSEPNSKNTFLLMKDKVLTVSFNSFLHPIVSSPLKYNIQQYLRAKASGFDYAQNTNGPTSTPTALSRNLWLHCRCQPLTGQKHAQWRMEPSVNIRRPSTRKSDPRRLSVDKPLWQDQKERTVGHVSNVHHIPYIMAGQTEMRPLQC